MKECLEKRLKELRAELDCGQKMMSDLETKQSRLRESLLRISGAVQVLEEVLEQDAKKEAAETVAQEV